MSIRLVSILGIHGEKANRLIRPPGSSRSCVLKGYTPPPGIEKSTALAAGEWEGLLTSETNLTLCLAGTGSPPTIRSINRQAPKARRSPNSDLLEIPEAGFRRTHRGLRPDSSLPPGSDERCSHRCRHRSEQVAYSPSSAIGLTYSAGSNDEPQLRQLYILASDAILSPSVVKTSRASRS